VLVAVHGDSYHPYSDGSSFTKQTSLVPRHFFCGRLGVTCRDELLFDRLYGVCRRGRPHRTGVDSQMRTKVDKGEAVKIAEILQTFFIDVFLSVVVVCNDEGNTQ